MHSVHTRPERNAGIDPPADFAETKSVAVRRKSAYFPSENPKNYVFRRAINDRPYIL